MKSSESGCAVSDIFTGSTEIGNKGISASSSQEASSVTSPQNQGTQLPRTSQRSNVRATPTIKSKSTGSNDGANNSESADVDVEGSVIPPLSHVVIKNVVAINDALIKVCLEFQNKNWTNEPDYAIYQRRLQSNLTYLSAVADYYLDPKQESGMPNVQLDMTPFPTPKIRSAKVLNSLLCQANSTFRAKTMAIDPRLNLRDKVAAVRAAASMSVETQADAITDPKIPNPSPLDIYSAHKVYDPPASECGYESYVPFPPFRLPPEIKLPFEN